MIPLPRPPFSSEYSFRMSVSGFPDPDLRLRLGLLAESVISASADFELAFSGGQLCFNEPLTLDYKKLDLTKREIRNLYTKGMVSYSSGRVIYDRIKGSGKCPTCRVRTISQLDHYLPKNKFPLLAVTPLNLVPSCSDCNYAKRAHNPRISAEVLLHPYFEDISGQVWLRAVVEETNPPTISYFVDPPESWSDDLSARVRFQFDMLGLAELYSIEAATELSEMWSYLSDLHGGESDGHLAVQDHLHDIAVSRANVAPNGWRAAAYAAMATSEWYCRQVFMG